jgi:hypothetical protein
MRLPRLVRRDSVRGMFEVEFEPQGEGFLYRRGLRAAPVAARRPPPPSLRSGRRRPHPPRAPRSTTFAARVWLLPRIEVPLRSAIANPPFTCGG